MNRLKYTPRQKFNVKKVLGFALSEVLIVLSILGVIFLLVVPALVTNASQYAFEKSQYVAMARIKEATSQMKSKDALSGYSTNEAFADEFANYMKFGMRCTSENLIKCFPSNFRLPNNDEIDASTLTTGVQLGHDTYTANTVGIVLTNGTTLILAFNPNCARIDPFDNSSDTTACLSIVYDTNGFDKPNRVGQDISLLNASIGSCSGLKIGSLCIANSDTTFSPINTCSSGIAEDQAYDPRGDANIYCATNYWAGAKKSVCFSEHAFA